MGARLWGPLLAGWVAWAGYAVHVATGSAAGRPATILYLAALAGAVVAAAVAARARPGMPAIPAALATAGYAFSSGYYTLTPDAGSAFPSLYDIPLFAFYPLAFLALAGYAARSGRVSGTLVLDSLMGALIVAALGALALAPMLDPGAGFAVTGQLIYVLADFGFIGFLLAAYTLSGLREGATLIVLLTGAVLLAIGDGSYFIDVANGDPAPDAVASLAWPAALLVLTLALYLRERRVAPRSSTWAKIGIPGAAATVGAPIEILSRDLGPARVLAVVALVLVVVRLMMSLHQNGRLLASVHGAATTDRLTGLANREALFDRLEQALARREGEGGHVAVLFLDLDEFKAINDAHGHELGDQVLIAVGERLRRAVRSGHAAAAGAPDIAGPRPHDTIARLGGDEFVVLLEGLRDPSGAVAAAERIIEAVRAPLTIGQHTLFVDTSIGISQTAPRDQRAPAELLRDGDTAMYEAKRAGRHRYEVFQPEMHEKLVARTELLRDLRGAVSSRQLRLLFQPQVDLGSGRMTGVEALVRWEHPEEGLLGPDRFIPLAESSGLIADIDDWVLREACAQLRRWDDAGLPSLDIAVNVSSRRLGTGDLPGTVAAVLHETGIEARRLELEVTETVAVAQDSAGVEAIAAVRELGVAVAIDDFGMGHSALSRLQAFPVDRLKIDRSFVSPLVHGAERGSLADAMIAMGQSLGLRVVAEGIETQEQLRALRALGCPAGQGYLFSRPLDAEAIAEIAAEGRVLGEVEAEPSLEGVAPPEPSAATQERLVRSMLAELQRLTGLETTYITRIEWGKAVQHITHARNSGMLEIPEGMAVDWSDTVCRRALEQGVTYTDDVLGTFPDSDAAKDLGLQTYLSVPLVNAAGEIEGTLCGASSRPVALGATTVQVMERFADIISRGVADGAGSPTAPARAE